MNDFIFKNKILFIVIFTTILFSTSITIISFNTSQDNEAQLLPREEEPIKEVKSNSIENVEPPVVKEAIFVEVGSKVPIVTDYFDTVSTISPESELKYYRDDKEVPLSEITKITNDAMYLSSLSTYKVVIIDGENEYSSQLNVVDTTIPTVVLKNVYITEGDKYSIKDFVKSYTDNSGSTSYSISYKDSSYSKLTKVGTHKIVITFCDQSKNCVDKSANLTINEYVLKVVKTITQNKVVKTEEIKYGVNRITSANVTYNVYNDGSKKEVSRSSTTTKIDYSTFNGTTSSMKSEAVNLYSSLQGTANTILSKTNQYRTEVNVQSLTLDKNLSIMATIRAIEMAYSDVFSHTRPNGSEWHTIWNEYYGKTIYGAIGENLAYGYSSDEAACVGWRNSQGHYENMIDSRFTKLGVGKYTFNGKTYWVQLFQS